MEKPQDGLISVLLQTEGTLRRLCAEMWMKFSASFLQWEPSEASRGYESKGQTRDV